jgi:pimeloyl-ACP methyl ester carboxylesterase
MTMLPLLVALLGPAAPAEAVSTVGVVELELGDPSRADPLAGGERRWRVDLYYPAQPGSGTPRTYAHDPVLLARMAKDGYYDVAPATLEAWARQPDGARANARALAAPVPLVTLSPGSGVAAFNYSELAATIVRRGYAVAVIDHPYLGLTHLADGRILSADADPVQQSDDPRAWQPRVVDWARDVSATLDLLPGEAAVRATGLALDPARVLAVGHSLGGTVAVEVCTREPRVSACADFEGAVEGTNAYTEGPRRPTLFTGSRSAKPDRPFLAPDFSQPPWDFLARGTLSTNWAVAISGGSHMSFSDAPREMPDTLSRFGGTLMSPERSGQVYAGIVDALGRAYFPGGGGNATMEAFFRDVPEAKAVHSGPPDVLLSQQRP